MRWFPLSTLPTCFWEGVVKRGAETKGNRREERGKEYHPRPFRHAPPRCVCGGGGWADRKANSKFPEEACICSSSLLPLDILKPGFPGIINIDSIQTNKSRNKQKPLLEENPELVTLRP